MSFVLRPPDEVVPLTQRLRGIGRTRRFALVAAGMLTLVAAVGVALAVMGTLDAWLHLASGVRAVGLLAILGLAGTMYVRNVRRPSQESVEPVAVAQFIEAKFPEFNDVLASAASFEGSDDGRTAAKFRRAAVRRAERMTNRHDLAGVVPTGRVWRSLAAALGTILLLGILILPDVGRAGVAAVRLFDPFGDHPWPPKTRIELTGPPVLLAKGDPYPVRFVVRGVPPADAVLSVKLVGGQPNEERLPLVRENEAGAVVTHTLLPDRVTRDFEFRVTANDADTGWHAVTVAAPPRLTLLDGRPSPQVKLTYQPYTNQRPTELPDGSGGIETVSGTRVTLKAAADRRIVRAVLRYEGDLAAVRVANDLACLAGTNPLLAPVAPMVSEHFATDIPVSVNGPDGRFLSADFDPPLSGLYSLRFTDEAGLTGVQKLDVRTFPDPAPVVALIRPTPSLDTLLLVPTATVTVRARADDRTYAVKKLSLEYRVNDGPFVEVPLADAAGVGLVVPGARPQPPDLEAGRPFPLAAFRRPDGKPPADGDTITLRAAATDWDDYTLAKPPGRSGEVEIRVMSEESLTAFLQKELAAMRPELSRATATQKEAADKTQQAKKATTPDGKLTPQGQDKLTQAEQAQRQARNQLADPRDGLRAKAEKLRDTAKANNLQKSPATQRAEAVARNLADLEDKHLPEIEQQLSAARLGDPKAAPEALAKAEKNQQAVVEKLTAAAEELEQWAAAAEVRGDARQLKDQVAKTAAEAKQTADRLPTGLTPDQLPPQDRAALEKLGSSLEKAAEQAGKLISKADRVAEEKRSEAAAAQKAADAKAAEAQQAAADAKAKPDGSAEQKAADAKANALAAEAAALKDAAAKATAEADTLEKAAKDAGRQAIADDLRKAAEAQKNNRSGEAAANAKSATDRLQKMTDELSERKDDVDELAKKRKDAANRVDQLADRQDELAKKANQANEMPDGDVKADAMQKLAAEQEQLRKETEQLSRKLDREGATDAAEQLRRAAKEMEQARDQLAEGQDPKAKPDEALERLEEAKQELEKPHPEQKDQLDREQREEFLQQFKTFLEKQTAAVAESERLTKAAVQAKKWERPLQASLSSLGDREKALAKEVRKFADDKTKEAKVFDTMLRQAADQMDKAAERVAERKADVVLADPAAFDAESETAADETTRRPMRAALRRLEQIVNSLKEDEKKKGGAQPMPMGGGAGQPMPMAGGGPMGPRGIPPLAQLKALRDWQAETNERTAAFAKDHPDREKLTDDDKDELQEIEQAQKDIAGLLDEILPLLQEQLGGGPP
jgi:hypothetical protein